jgi:outer membrane lipoprotein SlyB
MRKLAIAMVGALALAGCTTGPTTQVTRFHLNQPIAPGQISVEPMIAADHGSPEFQTYASIIGAELARIGFTEAPGLAKSEQVAVIQVDRAFFDGPPRSSFSIGIGGGNFGYHGGAGGSVGTTIAGKPTQNVSTRLIVQIKRRSDGTTIWEGRAETAARFGTPDSQPDAAVRRLASAVFQGFPGVSGRTITVK